MPRRPFLVAILLLLAASSTLASQPSRVGEDSDDAFAELSGNITLRFTDALTGKSVSGADVSFNGDTASTGRDGSVQFGIPKGLGPAEKMMEATFSKSGYVTTQVKLRFMAGSLFANRISVTPTLPPGKVRIVLDWEADPPDFDAHLVKEGGWHISFREMQKFEDKAFLDRDDMDGNGPETITVSKFDANATYRFFVHDFTNRGNAKSDGLSRGRPRVRIYTERGLWDAFDAPTTLKGDRWEVFSIARGQIVRAP